jgi:hypothetical protein
MYFDSHLEYARLHPERDSSNSISEWTSKLNICLQILHAHALPIRMQKYSSKMYGTMEKDGSGISYHGEDEDGFERALFVENGSILEQLYTPHDFDSEVFYKYI